jgi:transposase-like protein
MQEKKHYTPEFKVKIVREYLENQVSISILSEQYKINPNLIYKWKKDLFEGASEIFTRKQVEIDRKSETKIKLLEEKIRHKDSLISELVEDNVKLKKNIVGVS